MGFSGAKNAPCPPYTPLGTIESSKGLRPSRALRGFQPSCHPLRFLLKSEGFPGVKTARKRFFLWKMESSKPPRARAVHCTARVGSADRQPTKNFVGSQTLAAPIYGGQWSSIEPAAASGCRLSLPARRAGACAPTDRPSAPPAACPRAERCAHTRAAAARCPARRSRPSGACPPPQRV